MFRWLLLAVTPLFLFTGCGDLEPDMQDTRTVILNMDFHGKSSSRSSSSVSASELSQYNTHLILALPSGEVLTSNYNNYYSFAKGLMNTADNKVSLEIPLNTQMKIFAFLFEENYRMSQLFSGVREVGYYGESQTVSIGTQTNNLSLGITLIQVPGTGTDTTDTTPPVIVEVTPITTPTTDTTPDYTFSSSEAGTITYGGSCATAGSAKTNAIVGHNLIIFNTLSSETYSDCTITVTDSVGNVSNTLTITSFTVQTISTLPAPDNFSASGTSNSVTLTWNPVSGASSYTLYWDNVPGIDSSDNAITLISTDNYTHSNLDNGSTYYYKVAAVNSSGTGTLSSVKIYITNLWDGLVAHYPFNGNANDLTSNGRNLAVFDETNLIAVKDNSTNSAYSFDGVGDYLEYTTDIPSFDNYTISLWAKPASAGTYKAMFSSDNNSGRGFQIDLDGSKFRIRIAGVGNLVLGTALLNGDWTFIAFTYDGTNYKGYMNDNITESDPGGTTEFDLFRIGRNRNGNTYFSGAIDELRIYNRALTDSEISSLYANMRTEYY